MASNSNQALKKGTVLKGQAFTYTIDKVLGQGAFGITYLASTSMRGPLGEVTVQVALKEFFAKELDSRLADGTVSARTAEGVAHKYAKAFQRESENLSKMKHPGIVNVLEAFEDKGTYYYSMEYLSGGSLDEKVKGKGLPESEALPLIKKICEALAFMHSKKVMHLDLKPKNIMLKSDGGPVIIDFGLSKQYDEDGEPESSSTIGLGTPGYAPLEQANQTSGHIFQPTLDIYALGATLYKMLTGSTPPVASEILNEGFPEETLEEMSVSSTTLDAIRKAMSAAKKKRPQSVGEFLSMLDIKARPTAVHENPSAEPTRSDFKADKFAIFIGMSDCILATLGKDNQVLYIEACKTNDVIGPSNELFKGERFERFLKVLLFRVTERADLRGEIVCIIVPTHFGYREYQYIWTTCEEAGIERARIMNSDYAYAIGYLVQSGEWDSTIDDLDIDVIGGIISTQNRRDPVQSYTTFKYGSGVLEQISYNPDAYEFLTETPVIPERIEIPSSQSPTNALLGVLSYMKVLTGEDKNHLLVEAIRGGDLQLRWGKDGDSFMPIVLDGDPIPAMKSIRIKIGEAQCFALYQGSSFDGYLGSILLDNKKLHPDDMVSFVVDIDASKFISIYLEKDGQVIEKRRLSRPYLSETLHHYKYPYMEASDDETELRSSKPNATIPYQENGHEWVDLGLPSGLKWATCNVGAASPEEAGDYFAWGETEPKDDYDWNSYSLLTRNELFGLVKAFSKYDKDVDGSKTTLDPTDDAAHSNWGGRWRMPTRDEWEELGNPANCLWIWMENYNNTGINGYKVSSKKHGFTDHFIFLPASGVMIGSDLDRIGINGFYWSSNLRIDNTLRAEYFFFSMTNIFSYYSDERNDGLTVRPVID